MRGISIISAIIFSFGSIVIWCFHHRVSKLEEIVMDRCNEIDRLGEMTENLEELVESIKADNQRMIEWIRDDNKTTYGRIEKSLAEIRTKMYRTG
ncbi:MAG: hypothetical protein J7K40_13760 [candidate division Zixibacteria bacterium]|nr:hypothetical protein [candidate division Zixibacteria bacterium]